MDNLYCLRTLEFDKVREILLGYCLTEMSAEKVRLMRPETELSVVSRELDIAEEMNDLLKYDDAFPIEGLQDIRSLHSKLSIEGAFLLPPELMKVLHTLEVSRKIKSYIMNRAEKYPHLRCEAQNLHSYADIENRIRKTIDEQGEVADHASPKLRQIRRDMEAKTIQIRKKTEQIARQFTESGYMQEAMVTLREGRMVLPVKDEYKNQIKGFIHDVSASGQTVFIEPVETLSLNNELKKLIYEEAREIERILAEVSQAIREHKETLFQDLDILGRLEFLYVKARFTVSIDGIKPYLNDSGHVRIKNGKHPLLLIKESVKPFAERKPIVPLNLELGKPQDQNRILIITGPNAGGKTVALKTIGLFAVMAQSGLLIPADKGSHIGVFKHILADIGDEQSIENDLSTFSSHMQNLAEIVNIAEEGSLILVDEIGSGTDPREGCAIAISVMDYLRKKRSLVIVTTHHSELKAYAHNTPGVLNGSMAFDNDTLSPTYQFIAGIPGSSYAFEITRRMGLKTEIIEKARKIMGASGEQLDRLIQDLQNRITEEEESVKSLNVERSRLEGLKKLYEERAQEFKSRERSLKLKMLNEKEKFFREAYARLEKLVEEIKTDALNKELIKKAKNELRAEDQITQSEIRSLTMEEKRADIHYLDTVQPGDRVYVPSLDLQGTVLSVPDSAGQVEVGVGSIKMKIRIKELAAPLQTAEEKPLERTGTTNWDSDQVPRELDLRGLTAEEAIELTHEYIADAYVLGYPEVTLVHGKGSGILRKKIGEYLKSNQRVQSFRLGQWGEGDSGVTVVEIKKD